MGKRSNLPRHDRDFYPTPLKAVLPLVPHLRGIRAFAEPCAGEGDLVRHLESFGLWPCNRSQNIANAGMRPNNTSGFKGVTRHEGKWQAAITYDYKRHYLGTFSTPEAAHKAYCRAGRTLFGDFFYDGSSPAWTTSVLVELFTTGTAA
jgi:hypothetical protein